jgi:three-Cys-motif partner protein
VQQAARQVVKWLKKYIIAGKDKEMASTKDFFKQKREWSKLKDEILEKYLEPYLEKIKIFKNNIAIIDCFAGKGRFDDGAEGSPLIILKKISSSHARQLTHAYFIEEKYGDDLEKNVALFSGMSTVFKKNYQTNIANIKSICKNKNVFLYIDPYGIKTLDFKYFQQFKAGEYNTIELLLNFNTFGFLREGCRLLLQTPSAILDDDSELVYEDDELNTIDNMNNIANGDYWQGLIREFYNNQEKLKNIEIAFSQKYESELKKIFKYVVNIPVINKTTSIPKYRMYYGSNSTDGLFLMVDQMNRTWKNILKIASHGQNELFNEESEVSVSKYLKVFFPIDYKASMDKLFNEKNSIDMRSLYVRIIEISGITYSTSEYRKEIRTLEEEGYIKIQRENARTTTGKLSRALNFEKQDIFIERVK